MRIIIADDHALYLEGTKRGLSMVDGVQIVAEAVNGEQALAFCKNLKPDVLFLDVQMPGKLNGIQVLAQLQESGVKVIGLSAYENPEYIKAFQELGAVGYMSKSEANQDNLEKVLSHIQQNTEFWLSIELSDRLLAVQKEVDAYQLSPTEFSLIPYVLQGNSAKEIAEKRFKSERTIINQLDSLRSKTNCATYPELVAWANRFVLGDW